MKYLLIAVLAISAQARCLKSHVVDYKNGEFVRSKNCIPYPAGDSYCRDNYGSKYKATKSQNCELQTNFEFSEDILREIGLIDPTVNPKPRLDITTRDLYLHECSVALAECECPSGVKVESQNYLQSPTGLNKAILSCQPLDQFADDVFQNCIPLINTLSQNIRVEDLCCDPAQRATVAAGCFEFVLPTTLKYAQDFPARCWYSTEKFTSNFGQFKKQLLRLLDDREDINCKYSICTTSTSLMMANYYRDTVLKNENLNEIEKEKIYKKIWSHINISATPNELVEELKIGSGHTQHASLNEIGKDLLPQPGDFVQIWRNNNPVTGHSVIFKGFTKNNDESVKEICYFSSQPGTRGYGVQCEDIKRVDKLLIGHLTAQN